MATETPRLVRMSPWVTSRGCSSQACFLSHALSPLKMRGSRLAGEQQLAMVIGDHNLSEQIPVAFASGCCTCGISGRQRKIKHDGIGISGSGHDRAGSTETFWGIWGVLWYVNNEAPHFKISSRGFQNQPHRSSWSHQPYLRLRSTTQRWGRARRGGSPARRLGRKVCSPRTAAADRDSI